MLSDGKTTTRRRLSSDRRKRGKLMARGNHDIGLLRNARQLLKGFTDGIDGLRKRGFSYGLEGMPSEADAKEARANVELAYRHLEDAGMRLGKAIQALDGGTSVSRRRQVALPPPPRQ